MTRQGRGAETKQAIRLAAMAEFRKRGYHAATLEDIADQLGITRPAILNHYGSKAELLRAVVDPYLDALSDAIAKHEPTLRCAPRQRRLLMTDIADAIGAHAQVAGVLMRDITCHADEHIGQRCTQIAEQLLILLAGPEPTSQDRIIATATFGAVAWPLTQASIDLDDPDVRRLLVDRAIANSGSIDRESHRPLTPVAAS
jgi:AcrR family transcriptional regulator